jgi:Helicase associated domain
MDCTLFWIKGDVPTKNKKNRALGRWVSTQRSNYKKYKKGMGTLRPKTDDEEMERRIRCLEGIGFKWSLAAGTLSSEEDAEEENNDSQEESDEIESKMSPQKTEGNNDDDIDDGTDPPVDEV